MTSGVDADKDDGLPSTKKIIEYDIERNYWNASKRVKNVGTLHSREIHTNRQALLVNWGI